jgi:anti-sigma regulatory factor (Ser/Thr protein kinase)
MAAAAPDIELSMPAAPSAARLARRAMARSGLVGEGQKATLLLLVSELVSNCVRHAGLRAGERIQLRARARADRARVEVCDMGRSGRLPAKREPGGNGLEPGGLGLVLVDEMADRWGVHRRDDQTCVWFELACEA